jgi:hypothetical protein
MIYEYFVLSTDNMNYPENLSDKLNELALDGWHINNIIVLNVQVQWIILERPKILEEDE